MIEINFDKMGGLIPAYPGLRERRSTDGCLYGQKTLDLTLRDGKTWFFSRTGNKYWMKGEESGLLWM